MRIKSAMHLIARIETLWRICWCFLLCWSASYRQGTLWPMVFLPQAQNTMLGCCCRGWAAGEMVMTPFTWRALGTPAPSSLRLLQASWPLVSFIEAFHSADALLSGCRSSEVSWLVCIFELVNNTPYLNITVDCTPINHEYIIHRWYQNWIIMALPCYQMRLECSFFFLDLLALYFLPRLH